MKHRFPSHSPNHTSLLVDITGIGVPSEVLRPEEKPQTVPTLRFSNVEVREGYIGGLGATGEQHLDGVEANVDNPGVAIVTTTWREAHSPFPLPCRC